MRRGFSVAQTHSQEDPGSRKSFSGDLEVQYLATEKTLTQCQLQASLTLKKKKRFPSSKFQDFGKSASCQIVIFQMLLIMTTFVSKLTFGRFLL